MEDETVDHLWTAEQNRDLARALLGPDARSLRPRRREWTGIVAFYSAVHYANAYLWEARRVAPTNHQERREAFSREAVLRPVRGSYRVLQEFAFDARYVVPFAASDAEVRDLTDVNLRAVEAAVLRALGLAVPTWQLPGPL